MPCWSVCNMAAASPPEVTSRVVEVSNFAAMSTTAPAVSAPAAPTLSSDPDTLPSPLCHPGVAAAALSVAAPTPASDLPDLFACATNPSVPSRNACSDPAVRAMAASTSARDALIAATISSPAAETCENPFSSGAFTARRVRNMSASSASPATTGHPLLAEAGGEQQDQVME